jgi:hypothetical protein
VEVSLSLSTESIKRGNKRKWALLFAFLGVAGAGCKTGKCDSRKLKSRLNNDF